MPADLAPFVLFESRKAAGLYGLELGEDAMLDVMDVFDDHAQYGNGFGWNAVSRQVVRAWAPELAGRFRTFPEPTRWRAASEDHDALLALGRHLAAAYRSRELLSSLILGADAGWFE